MKSNKTWSQTHAVTKQETVAYARATNEQNARYEQGAVAPPMYAVFLEMPPLMAAVKDPEVIGDPKRFLRLLHGEHDLRWHGPLVPGATYETIVRVQKSETKSSGEVITLGLDTIDQASKKRIVETVSTMFIRSEQPAEPGEKKPESAEKPAERQPIFVAHETVAADQALRYADASGDHNPIHKDPEIAKKAGLPGTILHGLCCLAFCQKAIVDQLCGGDPAKLKRLKVRFTKPVLMGQTIEIRAYDLETNGGVRTIGYDARVGSSVVLKDGVAEIA